ncbi:MAG TPA: hypothetical protein VHV31_05265, partial [Nitrolancea sp.]|nr:hypothetical protein [Nitrolancea sp.]
MLGTITILTGRPLRFILTADTAAEPIETPLQHIKAMRTLADRMALAWVNDALGRHTPVAERAEHLFCLSNWTRSVALAVQK